MKRRIILTGALLLCVGITLRMAFSAINFNNNQNNFNVVNEVESSNIADEGPVFPIVVFGEWSVVVAQRSILVCHPPLPIIWPSDDENTIGQPYLFD